MHGSTGGGWKRNAGSRHRAGPQPQNGDTMRFASACAESETQCHPVFGGGQVVHPAGGESYCRA